MDHSASPVHVLNAQVVNDDYIYIGGHFLGGFAPLLFSLGIRNGDTLSLVRPPKNDSHAESSPETAVTGKEVAELKLSKTEGFTVSNDRPITLDPKKRYVIVEVPKSHLTADEIAFWTEQWEKEPFDLKDALLREGWMNLEPGKYHKVFIVLGDGPGALSYRVTIKEGCVTITQRDTRLVPNLVGSVEIPMIDDQSTYDFVTQLFKGRQVV